MKKFEITYLGEQVPSVHIKSANFYFSYTPADDVVKPELKGKFRYFGGLQCMYEKDSDEYNRLESMLCDISENIISNVFDENQDII